MAKLEKLKWIIFSAGILIFTGFFINSREFIKEIILDTPYFHPSREDYLGFTIYLLFPSVIASLLGLLKKYWGTLVFSIWFLFWALAIYDEEIGNPILNAILIIIPSIIMFFAPFLRIVLRKELGTDK